MAATAESCTGGLIAALLTEIPGSSTVLERGFVVYSNAAKQELLGVPAETLASQGAVSRETAVAMAEGALRASARRGRGQRHRDSRAGRRDAAKPVGLVHFACARRGADGRARGAVRRHRAWGSAARLGQGRPRSSRGGAEPVNQVHLVEWNELGSKSFMKQWANDFGDGTDERHSQDSLCSPPGLRIRGTALAAMDTAARQLPIPSLRGI